MPSKDPRIDAYIAKSADFSRPILEHFRKLVHEAHPDIEETIKWGFPHFMHNGIVCSIASFKQHCAINFWRGRQVIDEGVEGGAMGQFGKITSLKDLPPRRTLIAYIRKAVELNDSGTPTRRRPKPSSAPKEIEIPENFAAALKKNKQALARFQAFPPSHRKEYIQWIVEAKKQETREARIKTALEWIAEGKSRNWKYEKC